MLLTIPRFKRCIRKHYYKTHTQAPASVITPISGFRVQKILLLLLLIITLLLKYYYYYYYYYYYQQYHDSKDAYASIITNHGRTQPWSLAAMTAPILGTWFRVQGLGFRNDHYYSYYQYLV